MASNPDETPKRGARGGGAARASPWFTFSPHLHRAHDAPRRRPLRQQQQLAIARALAAGPQPLILDEPTEGIQPSIIKDIGRVIRMLAMRGTMAIVLVEQYYDFAAEPAEPADQYLVMERGTIVPRGAGAGHAARRRAPAHVDLTNRAL